MPAPPNRRQKRIHEIRYQKGRRLIDSLKGTP
ncbi:unnamed protein product [Gemmataceae bacterium]|nr:unnamed protein product [Gemmataceae bacterium]VTT96495.1 unnamed protein product [Gemmataceae bacterium]